MKLLDTIAHKFPTPRLNTKRIALALAVALLADGVQIALIPLGPLGIIPDELIDIVVMALTCWLLGFHVLLLPTFLLELIPGVGMLPTWTGCVVAVVALRRRAGSGQPDLTEVKVSSADAPPRLSAPPSGPIQKRPPQPDSRNEGGANPS